jgi:Phage tail tube protein
MVTAVTPRGKTINFLVGSQSAFGTLASGNWIQTFIRKHSLVMKQPFANDPVLGLPRTNNRDVTMPAPGLFSLAGNIEVPLDYNHIGVWLTAAFGAATDTGSADPYTHVFTSGGEALPFLSGEVGIQTPAGEIFMDYNSLLLSKLTFKASRTAGEETATCEFMGQQESENSASQGGTPAAPWARDMVVAAIGTFSMNSTPAANILEFNGTYDNKIKAQDYLGNSSGLISGIDLDDESTFSGTIKLRFRDLTFYTQAAKAISASGSSFDGTLSWTRSSSRLVQFDAPAMRIEPAGIPIEGPAGIDVSYTFRCEQSSTAPMLTTTIKNLVATYGSGP